ALVGAAVQPRLFGLGISATAKALLRIAPPRTAVNTSLWALRAHPKRATVLGGAMRISASDASAQSAATKTKTASVRCAVSARDPASSTLRFFILCSTQRRRLGRVDSEGPGPGRARA